MSGFEGGNVMTRWMAIAVTALGLALFGSAATAQELEPAGAEPPSEQPTIEPSAPAPAGDPGAQENGLSSREYIVEEGDTLVEIAEELLGSESEWPRIAEANGIEEPGKLRAGQRLLIPRPKQGAS
jgi:nucleoid-associated protein YgaU